ncbi:MAG: OmpH family outer membrane protein [Porphyromonadaceae bacterium]|nr:OmpH family outer membrane protein [Porphyromonadaceae bacterium]
MRKFLMALLVALPLSVFAQQKMAVVNTQEVMTALPEVKSAENKIQELAKKYDADIKSMQDEYKAKAEAFFKERDTLLETIRTRRQQEIQDIELRIQQSYQAMQEDLQKQQQQLLAPIQTRVATAIKKVATVNACTYVMESGVMLHIGSDAIDLTDKVKTELGVKPTAEKKP